MTISTRTPEGFPSKCPLCAAETNLEFSSPAGDAPCPNCGYLLWEATEVLKSMTGNLAETLGITEEITARMPLAVLGIDSLSVVELVMELEEDFDISIPEDEAQQIQTLGDAVRFILDQRKQKRNC